MHRLALAAGKAKIVDLHVPFETLAMIDRAGQSKRGTRQV